MIVTDRAGPWQQYLRPDKLGYFRPRAAASLKDVRGAGMCSVTVMGALMVSKALGFSISYRHGSEPPAYKYVKHGGEFGAVIKLKQGNKG